METIITSHGLNFAVQGDGFMNNRDDFERGVDAIGQYLDAQSALVVETAHRLSVEWMRADCSGDRPAIFDTLEFVGHRMATHGWHRPEAVLMFVSASV